MAYRFHVRPHPLGVVVYTQPGVLGELLIPDEGYCGLNFGELRQIADHSGVAEVADEAAQGCSLLTRRKAA